MNTYTYFSNKKVKQLKKVLSVALLASTLSFGFMPTNNAEAKTLGDDVIINAEFKDVKLIDAFDALSQLSNIPIIVHGNLTDKVAINTNGQSLAAIIEGLIKAFNLTCTENDGMYIIADKDADNNKISKTFFVNYASLADLQKDLNTFVESENISTSISDNTITVSGSSVVIQKAEEIIKARDVKQKQVTLQAKFVELSKDDAKSLGLNFVNGNWGRLSSDKAIPWKFTYDAYLYGTGSDDTGKVLARPTASAINGQKATINIADRVPILTTTSSDGETTTTVTYQDVGVQLYVTPRINQDTGFVTMDIDTNVSTITGWTENRNVTAPQISTRQVTTNIRCKSGQTVIIGGLLKKTDLLSISKVPILGDLPIFGRLFQYHNHTREDNELVVMITPIVEGWELRKDHDKYYDEETRPADMHNEETMEYLTHTDRRGRDDRLNKKNPLDYDASGKKEWSNDHMNNSKDTKIVEQKKVSKKQQQKYDEEEARSQRRQEKREAQRQAVLRESDSQAENQGARSSRASAYEESDSGMRDFGSTEHPNPEVIKTEARK